MKRHHQGAALSMTQIALKVLTEVETRLRSQAKVAQAQGDGDLTLARAMEAERLHQAIDILKDNPLPS